VLLALLPAASFAGMPGWDTEPLGDRGVSFFTKAWETIIGIWEKAGAGLDPHGNPGDVGGSIDPNGATTDTGQTIDPNG
jgi:hypothetical protein